MRPCPTPLTNLLQGNVDRVLRAEPPQGPCLDRPHDLPQQLGPLRTRACDLNIALEPRELIVFDRVQMTVSWPHAGDAGALEERKSLRP